MQGVVRECGYAQIPPVGLSPLFVVSIPPSVSSPTPYLSLSPPPLSLSPPPLSLSPPPLSLSLSLRFPHKPTSAVGRTGSLGAPPLHSVSLSRPYLNSIWIALSI
ncbi:unnamed protein product [Arctogadus glacialis]